MIEYFELSDKDRAGLTEAEVALSIKSHLMSIGIPSLPTLELKSVPDAEVKTNHYFGVKLENYGEPDVVFSRLEDADAFIRLNPVKVINQYHHGMQCVQTKDVVPQIVPIELPTDIEAQRVRSKAQLVAQVASYNDAQRADYESATKAISEASAKVWDDWYSVRSEMNRMQRIVNTYNDYLSTCDGNEQLAAKFLAKAYTPEQIAQAEDWCNVDLHATHASIDVGDEVLAPA